VLPFIMVLVVAAALLGGLLANRKVRPFADAEVKGVKLEALIGPIMSLTVLLLAFTLVNVFGSYQRAQQSASEEARKVDFLYELGGYSPEPTGGDLRAAVACYASAVASFEWPAMEQGRTAPQVSPWTAAIREEIAQLTGADDAPGPVVSAVLAADKERGEARSRRLTEARPAVPEALFALLIGSAAVGIAALSTFTLGQVARRVQIGVMSVLALLLAFFVGMVWDMDRPYDGVVAIEATDMSRVAADLRGDFGEDYPGTALPCDERGTPV
jgi:hypothetical protein